MSEFEEVSLETIDNQELLDRVNALVRDSIETDVALIAHLGEVDARNLHLGEGFCSMFAYCVSGLHMEEGVAFNRIHVARAARKHPVLLGALRVGELHLTGARLIAPHLTAENASDLVRSARHRSVREIRELIADLRPKPDLEASIRKAREPVKVAAPRTGNVEPAALKARGTTQSVEVTLARAQQPVSPAPAPAPRSEPLGGERYSVRFMADAECHAALEELRSLLRHQIPDGDLAQILKRAVLELRTKVRKRRFAELDAKEPQGDAPPIAPGEDPPSNPPAGASRHIPNAIARAVWKRDGGACTFVSRSGRRCGSRDFLEFDHLQSWALARKHSVEGIALRCRAHNQAAARAVFGDRHMNRFIRRRGPDELVSDQARGQSRLHGRD